MPAPHSTPDTSPQRHFATTDSPSYDLEFRSRIDDAWYGAGIVINDDTTLVVKLLDFPKSDDEIFSVGDSTTVDDVDEFIGRFRPISEQLQDNECGRVMEGIRVCASFTFVAGDVRYYDAIVESVIRKKHFFGKEEECKCEFLLNWQHGSHKGTITVGSIANICMVQPSTETDSRLASFSKVVKKKIVPSAISDLVSGCSASSYSYKHSMQDKQGNKRCHSPSGRTRGLLFSPTSSESTRISKLPDYDYQDREFPDIGGSISTRENLSMSSMGKISKKYSSLSRGAIQDKNETEQFLGSSPRKGRINVSCENDVQLTERKEFRRPAVRTGGLSCAEEPVGHHFIIVGNLEKDLSPSSIVKFIQKHTFISVQACTLPSLSSEPYTRGVIETDSEEKLKEICKFLQNPDHIITSSKGRPWFIHEEHSCCETFETTLRGAKTVFQGKTNVEELKIVPKGAPEYRGAKRMRDTFEAFAEHQIRLHKRLAWEEKQIAEMVDDASRGAVVTETDACMSAYFRGSDQTSKLEQLKELTK